MLEIVKKKKSESWIPSDQLLIVLMPLDQVSSGT